MDQWTFWAFFLSGIALLLGFASYQSQDAWKKHFELRMRDEALKRQAAFGAANTALDGITELRLKKASGDHTHASLASQEDLTNVALRINALELRLRGVENREIPAVNNLQEILFKNPLPLIFEKAVKEKRASRSVHKKSRKERSI